MPKDMAGVMKEWKQGKLHSGAKDGPVVQSQKQAIAIGLSEQQKMGASDQADAVDKSSRGKSRRPGMRG